MGSDISIDRDCFEQIKSDYTVSVHLGKFYHTHSTFGIITRTLITPLYEFALLHCYQFLPEITLLLLLDK